MIAEITAEITAKLRARIARISHAHSSTLSPQPLSPPHHSVCTRRASRRPPLASPYSADRLRMRVMRRSRSCLASWRCGRDHRRDHAEITPRSRRDHAEITHSRERPISTRDPPETTRRAAQSSGSSEEAIDDGTKSLVRTPSRFGRSRTVSHLPSGAVRPRGLRRRDSVMAMGLGFSHALFEAKVRRDVCVAPCSSM